MDNVYIQAFGISCYKSFGPEPELFPNLKKINLIIGQNNSGKSNVLHFLNHQYKVLIEACISGSSHIFHDLDMHLNCEKRGLTFFIGVPLEGKGYEEWSAEVREKIQGRAVSFQQLEGILRFIKLVDDDSTAWFKYESDNNGRMMLATSLMEEVYKRAQIPDHQWNSIWAELTGMHGGTVLKDWIPDIFKIVSPIVRNVPLITFIPAIREVGPPGGDKKDFSGIGLVNNLAVLQNPRYSQQWLKNQFEDINKFLQTVTANSTARIEIPAERDTIIAHINGTPLPLEALGTGIHEVIILAAAASVLNEQIICIEEPEIHLHPTLQKKLIQYLENNTSNQYFIATHSAHLLDASDASIYHITLNDGCSRVNFIQTPRDKSEVCTDLGYRASDLLQSNCIIWVEGPSDRIYLRHWISAVAPDLLEGIHFSIMFYGGRLLSHLSADDPEIDEFISLRRLNRHISIIMDSDRSKKGAKLNETKRRVEKELSEGPGFAWITKGREIENYISPQVIESAIREVHRDVKEINEGGTYANMLGYINRKNMPKEADKVKVACYVSSQAPDLNILDLKAMVN